jgi:hypothetical protein
MGMMVPSKPVIVHTTLATGFGMLDTVGTVSPGTLGNGMGRVGAVGPVGVGFGDGVDPLPPPAPELAPDPEPGPVVGLAELVGAAERPPVGCGDRAPVRVGAAAAPLAEPTAAGGPGLTGGMNEVFNGGSWPVVTPVMGPVALTPLA